MAISQTNGSAITRTSTKNNGGACLKGIGKSGALITSNKSANTVLNSVSVVSGINNGPALIGGTFADNNSVILRVTNSLAGKNNNFINSTANITIPIPTAQISGSISSFPSVKRSSKIYTFSKFDRFARISTGIKNNELNSSTGQWNTGSPAYSVVYWPTPVLKKVAGRARYFLPNMNEYHKAAYYDPTIGNANDSLNYWLTALRTNDIPSQVQHDVNGNGLLTNNGVSVAHGNITWVSGQDGNGMLTVGTTGRSSYYGTYDQNHNQNTITETVGGGGNTTIIAVGMSSEYISYATLCSFASLKYQWTFASVAGYASYPHYGLRICSYENPNGINDLVLVGNAGNSADNVACSLQGDKTSYGYGLGAVNYTYYIGKYNITNEEYMYFLNSIAMTDTYTLYRPNMGNGIFGGIQRKGSSGSYYYVLLNKNWARKPIGYLGFYQAARYCNWLHNNKPVGPQITATTEDGAYTLNGNVTTRANRNT